MPELRPLSILMVEDNIDHADLMKDALTNFNSQNRIHHVEDGEQAIYYLKNEHTYENKKSYPTPDIIFLDIRMPRQDGIKTLKIIKEDNQLKSIPIIMISTSQTNKEIKECYQLGANTYIVKPLQFDELSRKISGLNTYWSSVAELPPNNHG